MNLTDLMRLRAWSPLSEVCHGAELVMDGIYKVAPDLYLRTQPHDRNFAPNNPRAPFVTKGYWVPTIAGLRRLVAGIPDEEIDGPLPAPPAELGQDTSGYYSELTAKITLDSARTAERAVYSNKGTFLYRMISIGRLAYCFPSHEDKEERAFAIGISLLR
jgi:hypothetical protein